MEFRQLGHSGLEVSLVGLVAPVIAGATKPEQVIANAATAERTLSAEDRAALDEILPSPHPERRV